MSFFAEDEYTDAEIENITAEKSGPAEKTFTGCTFRNCDFSGVSFSSSLLESCVFEECNLTGAAFPDAKMQNICFIKSKLMGINFTLCSTFALGLSFEECYIHSCDFSKMKLKKTVFTGCVIFSCDFVSTDLTEAELRNSSFKDTVFDRTNLAKADFSGAGGYCINPFNNNLRKAKFSLPDAVSILEQMDIIIK